MATLPSYHVPRPRLTQRLASARVGLVEAGGGYGKSVVAAELAAGLGVATATAILGRRDRDAHAVVERLRDSLTVSGLTDLAAAIGPRPAAAEDAVEDLVAALRLVVDPVLIVIDEAHVLSDRSGGRLLDELATRLPLPNRLLVVGRRLPAGAEDLRTLSDAVSIDASDLAFTDDEVRALLAGFGLRADPHQAARLRRATAGWPAALVLAAPRLARSTDIDAALAEMGSHASLQELVSRQLATLERADRDALVELAHLPTIDPDVADEVASAGFVERVVEAGLPFAPGPVGSWQLPGPVQEHLAALGPLRTSTATLVGRALVARGRPGAAIAAHLAAEDTAGAAALIAGLSPEQAYQLDDVVLASAIEAFAPATIAAHPRVLVHFARACEASFQMHRRTRALAQAHHLAAGAPVLLREIDAERARDLIRDARPQEADELAAAVLSTAEPGEIDTRARALDVRGRVRAWRRDAASLAEAERMLEEAHALFRSLGRRTWTAQIVMPLAIHVYLAQARYEVAVERLDEALEGLAGRDRLRAVILTFRAQVLDEAGRFAEADANLREAHALGELFADRRILAYAAWEQAVAASQQGDRAATIAFVGEADRQRGDWFDHDTGADFLAASAEALARVDEMALAWNYLAQAVARVSEAELVVTLARGALEARAGDPVAARAQLARVRTLPRLEPREAWRVRLFEALAAYRAGEPAAATLARQALAEAAALGHPALPYVREPSVMERLAPLLAADGASAADADERGPVSMRALGEFTVIEGGAATPVPAGLPTQLVKFVVAAGGRAAADAAIEALWPEAEPESGRRGLRNVLLRLGAVGRPLVIRDGQSLVLAPDIDLDVIAFERDAQRAFDGGSTPEAVVVARSAIAQYRGPLLPDDVYADWAAGPRERLRLRHLRLLDLLIADAAGRHDLDEAVHFLERAIDADPWDETRYLAAARLLLDQGRRGRAIAMLRRGETMLTALGVVPPEDYRRLESSLGEVPAPVDPDQAVRRG